MSDAQSRAKGPAITALGTLFKLTEVFLLDEPVVDSVDLVRLVASAEEPTNSCTTADANSSLKQSVSSADCIFVEAMELAREMDALGLPISFSTSKERNGTKIKKKKGTRVKSLSAGKDTMNSVSGISDINDREDATLSNVFHDSTNMLSCWRSGDGLTGASHCVLQKEQINVDLHSDDEPTHLLTAILSETSKERQCDLLTDMASLTSETIPDESDLVGNAQLLGNPVSFDAESCSRNMVDRSYEICQEVHSFDKQYEVKCLEGSDILCHSINLENDCNVTTFDPAGSSQSCTLMNNHTQGYLDNSQCYEFGDWRVVWDAFYSRNYFYNCRTQESTWYPPQGLEHFAFACSTPLYKADADEARDSVSSGVASDIIQNEDAHSSLVQADSSEENGYSIECVKQSSEDVSSTIDDATCISTSGVNRPEHSYKHYEASEVSEEQASPLLSDVKMCSIDELFDHVMQKENVICREAWSSLDILLDGPICDSGLQETYMTALTDEVDSNHDIATFKKKKRPRRLQPNKQVLSAIECELMFEEVSGGVSVNILKYWYQRHSLFSRYDYGIKMDEEGWFSVTPEAIARHHASRCGSTVIDCFTGVGGNAIQFAMRSNHVIAIDIDPQKVDYARENAAIYGVDDMIDFIQGDFFKLAPCLKGNTVFMSPPWGGPGYSKVETYDISMLKPHNGYYLFKIGRAIASKVVFFLPRNIDINQLAELSLSVDPPWALEVEKNYLNGWLKGITAYFTEPTL